MWSCLSFPHQNPVCTSIPYMLYALPISLLILSVEYLVRSTEHQAPPYIVCSTPLLPRPS
jgi:hypothetical protein